MIPNPRPPGHANGGRIGPGAGRLADEADVTFGDQSCSGRAGADPPICTAPWSMAWPFDAAPERTICAAGTAQLTALIFCARSQAESGSAAGKVPHMARLELVTTSRQCQLLPGLLAALGLDFTLQVRGPMRGANPVRGGPAADERKHP